MSDPMEPLGLLAQTADAAAHPGFLKRLLPGSRRIDADTVLQCVNAVDERIREERAAMPVPSLGHYLGAKIFDRATATYLGDQAGPDLSQGPWYAPARGSLLSTSDVVGVLIDQTDVKGVYCAVGVQGDAEGRVEWFVARTPIASLLGGVIPVSGLDLNAVARISGRTSAEIYMGDYEITGGRYYG